MARPLAEADIDRATQDMAAPLELTSHSRRSMLVFACGTELFAIPARDVAKVVPDSPVHRVPHRTNAIFRGICNRDGELLLCMDLEQALGLAAPPEGGTRVQVVVGGVRDRWSFLVDRILGVTEVGESAMQPAPVTVGTARRGCVTTLAQTVDGTASVVELPRLNAIFRGAVS
jgi:chemotaxis signal transduction protein